MTSTGRLKTSEPEPQNVPLPREVARVLSAIEHDHKKSLREMASALQLDYTKVERVIMEAANG